MHKRFSKLTIWLSIVWMSFLMVPNTAEAGVVKWIRQGSYWKPFADSGDEGEGNIGWGTLGLYYYHGFTRQQWSSKAWFLGTKDFTDTTGTTYPVMISGNGQWEVDETKIVMPVPDANGFTIKKYLRYAVPEIYVDGFPLHDPFFGREADESVDPAYINQHGGNADAMLESTIRTNMGLTIHRKVLGFGQKNHDDYLVDDWTFTNTGNADLDDAVEYPSQTLKDVYFFRQIRPTEANGFHQNWVSSYGALTTDTLRFGGYAYTTNVEGETYDQFGEKVQETGKIQEPAARGETILHIDTSPSDETDNPAQPHMTDAQDCDLPFVVRHPQGMSATDWTNLYQTMQVGLNPYDASPQIAEGTHPDTYHGTPFDTRGYKYATDYEYFGWSMASVWAAGPFTLEPGEDFKIVWADVVGSISFEKGWEVGKAWLGGNSETAVPFPGEDNLPKTFQDYPELAPTDNDKNADRWIYSSIDTMHMNANAAKWAYENDYMVPSAPPAPSVYVYSKPGYIQIDWGSESEAASDFAGYRVYRSVGHQDSTWSAIADYPGSGTHSHQDATASRGTAYFYSVVGYDDGTSNAAGVKGVKEVLESSKYVNRTTKAAYLTRPAGSLEEVIIVPNPFNISAASLQFTGEQDKIMFYNVPGYCMIDIYTESGDHVKSINHNDGSGDQAWGVLTEEFSATKSSQVIVSGVYIARIEETDESGNRSGNAVLKKFLVVR